MDSATQLVVDLNKKISSFDQQDRALVIKESAQYYIHIGDYQAASDAWESLLDYLPKNSDTLYVIKFEQARLRFYLGEDQLAFEMLEECEEFFLNSDEQLHLMRVYSLMAAVHNARGQVIESIKSLQKGIDLAEQMKDPVELSKLYSNLSHVYYEIGEYKKALELSLKSYQNAKKSDDEFEIHLSERYLGGAFFDVLEYDSAFFYLDQSKDYFEQIYDVRLLSSLYIDLGKVCQKLNKNEEAEEYLLASIDLTANTPFSYTASGAMAIYGMVLNAQSKYQRGVDVCLEGKKISQEQDYDLSEQALCECLYQNYKSLGIYDSALVYFEKYGEIKEQITADEIQKAVLRTELETSFQKEKGEILENTEKQMDEARSMQNVLMVGVSLLVISLSLLLIAFIQKRKSVKFIEKEKVYLDNLVHNIVHEFRTPLTLIKGPSEELLQTDQGNTYVRLIHKNADKMLDLVNQVLDFAKLKAGKLPIINELTDLNVFFSDCIEVFLPMARERGVELINPTKIEQSVVSVDSDKLYKIVSNLIGNAIKYSFQSGTVTIRYSFQNNWLTIEVEDNGQGISADDKKRVFEKFYQVDATATRKVEGTGLGLAFVDQLVELMEGKIELESEEGKGSLFRVSLPCLGSDAVLPEVAQNSHRLYVSEDTEVDQQGEVVKVLVVEDNPDLQNFLKLLLVKQGYDVIIAENGEVGIEKAIEIIPDIVISDVMMPKVDGYQLLEALKAHSATDHIPVLLLTAKVSFDSMVKGLEHGADDYIMKPFRSSELFLRIGNILQRQQKLREKYLSALEEESEKDQLHPLLEKIERFTLAEEGHQLSAEALAEKCGMSRSQLHRKVTQLTGVSTAYLQNRIRLEAAKSDLNSKDVTVSEVAFKYGYSDPANFSRSFKKYFGVSPSQIKKN